MARRLFRGRQFSENGWPYVDEGSCTWRRIPGAEHVSLQIQNGPPLQILSAFAADFHAHVEPLRDEDSACWTRDNSVDTSNHPGGTSMDLNWEGPDRKAFRLGISEAQAYPGDKARKLRELLDFYEGVVFCGGAWSIRDWMHFQLGAGTYLSDNKTGWDGGVAPKTLDFIARKIRPDGFSTFKRGASTTSVSGAVTLATATGLTLSRATELLPAITAGLAASECTTPNRIAMWLAQVGHESVSFQYTEEIAKNGRYAPYIGRTWIQITWDYNYRDFSKWCFDQGLVPTPDYFVQRYTELADVRWAGIGAAWYWTAQRPMNALVDAGDSATWKAGSRTYYGFEAVTAAINGGLNGLADRRARYDRAIALGDQLLALTSAPTEQDEWEALMADETLYPSLSPYRTDDKPVLKLREVVRQTNGMVHAKLIEDAAIQGHPGAIAAVAKLAQGQGPGATDLFKVEQAKAIIRTIQANLAAQLGAAK